MREDEIFQTIPKWAPFSETSQRKTQKNHVLLTRKFHWKSWPTTHLYFPQNNFTILQLLAKTFAPEMKPSECPTKKTQTKKSKRSREERKRNFFSAVHVLNAINTRNKAHKNVRRVLLGRYSKTLLEVNERFYVEIITQFTFYFDYNITNNTVNTAPKMLSVVNMCRTQAMIFICTCV